MLHHPLIPANPDSTPVQHIFNKAFFLGPLVFWTTWMLFTIDSLADFFPSLVGPKLNGASYKECTLDLMNYHLVGWCTYIYFSKSIEATPSPGVHFGLSSFSWFLSFFLS